ncbi:class IV adenylate cyclase [Methanocella sp. CWC-04]|uniref:Class IV adenylate cyclase n=1 Tax=Methanooceanicella nereidis TaxID=2052831 RepID=A0AAP2RB46_9EURY|nr:class IV adenylate cyclase [Methanocella sp. CWC-04]MCD1293919.1 class IV adenylate cyclase [Methanocella sp. CWC-04]
MIEVEMKVRSGNNDIIQVLKDAGAVFEKSVRQTDSYYNAPHRDFGETDEALRLREQSGKVYMTYKGKKLDLKSKTRKEVEVEVDNYSKMEDILLSLGFKKTLSVSKQREIYHLMDAEICVDRVDGLGDFIEFEMQANGMGEVDEKREKLFSLIKSLGIEGEFIRESYLEMILLKNKGL